MKKTILTLTLIAAVALAAAPASADTLTLADTITGKTQSGATESMSTFNYARLAKFTAADSATHVPHLVRNMEYLHRAGCRGPDLGNRAVCIRQR